LATKEKEKKKQNRILRRARVTAVGTAELFRLLSIYVFVYILCRRTLCTLRGVFPVHYRARVILYLHDTGHGGPCFRPVRCFVRTIFYIILFYVFQIKFNGKSKSNSQCRSTRAVYTYGHPYGITR